MKIINQALAGTMESSDLMVKISPADGELDVVIHSEVIKQFGDQIRQVVLETLSTMGVTQGLIIIEDKGALDCVIRARLQTALLRASGQQPDWGVIQ
ncbi:citrate lyase acyl carrier protein [Shimwellia blattae]|uniref:Citrate lyase acyl carrier protein n=1 Tax=Shimwellia blattae (strain ATCC 29907 / DSM 4481 / JCM 1650 / NBRC 105725 / CDC 9005-74) TaxID=630626 RepID=I2B5H2_SHIBC|nr:citrate lyase acyl carrier protein [Shimwellia blattae]AFJ45776.1 citrate lyase acyl carrier protein [Shimwellia blattae DSM 4481 = NBRC 105725]GAB82906.1 citrate lyase acyl carrier protein [Shimwellia blattae DSM 4481 = NBRC 105725]VDY63258.1 Citrate lyase gamma chain [Shimwellia blattae]VEC20975.1 Citrate lyase gamma chain [Shimwellia blattae]